jgi:hypothetical protein
MSDPNFSPETQPTNPSLPVEADLTNTLLTPELREEIRGLFPEEQFQNPDMMAVEEATSDSFSEEKIAELKAIGEADGAEGVEIEAALQIDHDKYVTSGLSVLVAIDETTEATLQERKRQSSFLEAMKVIDPPEVTDSADEISERNWDKNNTSGSIDVTPRFNR